MSKDNIVIHEPVQSNPPKEYTTYMGLNIVKVTFKPQYYVISKDNKTVEAVLNSKTDAKKLVEKLIKNGASQ